MVATRSNSNQSSSSHNKPGPVPAESIRVEDKIYSARKLADMHPGGPLFIKVRHPIS